MYLNSFSVRIPEGAERQSGYVEIQHGKQYTISLRNRRPVRCDAEVEVDGKYIGTFRIPAMSSISLERPTDDSGRFTFYSAFSKEAKTAGSHSIKPTSRGLIQVTFIPEKERMFVYTDPYYYVVSQRSSTDNDITYTYTPSTTSTTIDCCTNCSPGITGLSGHSDQCFHQADEIDRDYEEKTVIFLRLVVPAKDSPRPLRAVSYSTPIPPPVSPH